VGHRSCRHKYAAEPGTDCESYPTPALSSALWAHIAQTHWDKVKVKSSRQYLSEKKHWKNIGNVKNVKI